MKSLPLHETRQILEEFVHDTDVSTLILEYRDWDMRRYVARNEDDVHGENDGKEADMLVANRLCCAVFWRERASSAI